MNRLDQILHSLTEASQNVGNVSDLFLRLFWSVPLCGQRAEVCQNSPLARGQASDPKAGTDAERASGPGHAGEASRVAANG